MKIIGCPFCGIKPHFNEWEGRYWIDHPVKDAPHCPIVMPNNDPHLGVYSYSSKEEAIEAWTKRALKSREKMKRDKKMEWISVNDKLPERPNYDWVLAQIKHMPEDDYGVPIVAEYFNNTWHTREGIEDLEDYYGVKVTHWCEMPKHPNEQTLDRYNYRGKRLDNGEWVYGALFWSTFDESIKKHKEPTFQAGEYYIDTEINQVNPKTIGQCTGIKDKNGNLIYEGDIIATSNNNEEFDIWHKDDFGYARVLPLDPNKGFIFMGEQIAWNIDEKGSIYNIKFCEVIGNIYDKD